MANTDIVTNSRRERARELFDSVFISWQIHSGGLPQWSETGHKMSTYTNQPWDLFRNQILREIVQHSGGIIYPSPMYLYMFLFVKWNYMSTTKSFLSVFIYFVYQNRGVDINVFSSSSSSTDGETES